MSKKYISADHHFFHRGIITHCKRPYVKADTDGKLVPDVEAMNSDFVARWNSTVGKNDLMYYAGDFAYRVDDLNLVEDLIKRLNGKIHFVRGNHDDDVEKLKHMFESFQDMLEIKHNGHRIVICHYAMRVWNRSFEGSYHVYGHSHGTLPEDPRSLSFDVGVDCTNFTPISVEAVIAKMKLKEPNRRPEFEE